MWYVYLCTCSSSVVCTQRSLAKQSVGGMLLQAVVPTIRFLYQCVRLCACSDVHVSSGVCLWELINVKLRESCKKIDSEVLETFSCVQRTFLVQRHVFLSFSFSFFTLQNTIVKSEYGFVIVIMLRIYCPGNTLLFHYSVPVPCLCVRVCH